jgi:hypothetical protein
MGDWIALAIQSRGFRSNQFLLGFGFYRNPNPVPKGCGSCIYWVLDQNEPQYWVLGLDSYMWSQFSNKLGSDQRLIQSQYPVLGLILIWSPINTNTGIGLVTSLLVDINHYFKVCKYTRESRFLSCQSLRQLLTREIKLMGNILLGHYFQKK